MPYVYAYLDDITIVTETFEKHKECLKMVLEKLAAAGLSLNPGKCVFCKSEVAHLGFLVNRDSTRPNPAKVAPIKEYPTPKNLKDLRKFQGMNEFKVVTDHSSLRWLCEMKNPTSRLARWTLELQSHKFTVEHRKGALNYVADALSRMYEGEDGPELAALSWFTDTEDMWYQEWCAKVKEQPNDHPTYKLVASNLYRYRPNQEVEPTLGDDEDARKLVVPEEHRPEVLQE